MNKMWLEYSSPSLRMHVTMHLCSMGPQHTLPFPTLVSFCSGSQQDCLVSKD